MASPIPIDTQCSHLLDTLRRTTCSLGITITNSVKANRFIDDVSCMSSRRSRIQRSVTKNAVGHHPTRLHWPTGVLRRNWANAGEGDERDGTVRRDEGPSNMDIVFVHSRHVIPTWWKSCPSCRVLLPDLDSLNPLSWSYSSAFHVQASQKLLLLLLLLLPDFKDHVHRLLRPATRL